MPANRIVALLTPVIALAAGGAATWLADNLGLHVSQSELQAVFVAGLLAVLAPSAQWLHGFQKYEGRQQELDDAALRADADAAALASAVEDGSYDDYDDDEDGVDEEYEAARDEAEEPETVSA
jgi:hypothetical protein